MDQSVQAAVGPKAGPARVLLSCVAALSYLHWLSTASPREGVVSVNEPWHLHTQSTRWAGEDQYCGTAWQLWGCMLLLDDSHCGQSVQLVTIETASSAAMSHLGHSDRGWGKYTLGWSEPTGSRKLMYSRLILAIRTWAMLTWWHGVCTENSEGLRVTRCFPASKR